MTDATKRPTGGYKRFIIPGVCVAILLVAGVLFFVGNASKDKDKKDPPAEEKTLNIGVHITDSPGFNALKDGQRNGFEVDLANFIADGLHRHPNFIPITVDSRPQQLKAGYVDMVVSTFSITDKHIANGIVFAGPYLRTDQGIMVSRDNTTISSIADLASRTVCVTKGSTSAKKLDQLKNNVTLISTERDTLRQCIDDMKNPSTSVAAVTSDATILQGHARADTSLKFLPGLVVPGTYEKYGIGFSASNMELCKQAADLLKSFLNTQWNSAFNANLLGDGVNASDLKPDPSTIDTESCRTS